MASRRQKIETNRISHNPVGKVFSREELERVGALAVKHNLIILSDEVYDRLYYVPFTRIATLSPELYERTLTVGSAGKAFYATGWRVGYLIGPPHLIQYVAGAHTRICYSSVSPLQEASAVAFEKADGEGFWDQARNEMKSKVERFCQVFDELNIPVRNALMLLCRVHIYSMIILVFGSGRWLLRPRQYGVCQAPRRLSLPSACRQSAS
jgi:aspartate/methionine/tyrosine aminotransferase